MKSPTLAIVIPAYKAQFIHRALLQRPESDDADAGDLYRFIVVQVDAQSEVSKVLPEFPPYLSADTYLRGRLEGTLNSTAPDHVFLSEAWDQIGGFVEFPLAWCSNDATWFSLAQRAGIRTISGPRVYWRKSGLNISSAFAALDKQKAIAATSLVRWLRIQASREHKTIHLGGREFEQLAVQWLSHHPAFKSHVRRRCLSLWHSFGHARGWRGPWLTGGIKRPYWGVRSTLFCTSRQRRGHG